MVTASISTLTELLLQLTKQAGRLLKKNISNLHDVTFKGGPSNIVTEMDKAAEALFLHAIKKRFPSHDVLSEELMEDEKRSWPMIPLTGGIRWIIDPLDGTTNYAHGFPHFCVSAAIEKDGRIILGAVYNPMLNELFFAQRGKGATLNDKPIRVSTTTRLEEALLGTGFPYDFRTSKKNNIDHFYHFSAQSQAIRRAGSAALDLCNVACGRFDGFWEMKLKPWDIAAGALMITEAGGQWSGFAGQKTTVYDHAIAASNGKIHKKMTEILKKGRH